MWPIDRRFVLLYRRSNNCSSMTTFVTAGTKQPKKTRFPGLSLVAVMPLEKAWIHIFSAMGENSKADWALLTLLLDLI